jgi:hypothetical protein
MFVMLVRIPGRKTSEEVTTEVRALSGEVRGCRVGQNAHHVWIDRLGSKIPQRGIG